jgi:hypothetical protein
MFCSRCRTELLAGAQFCSKCGQPAANQTIGSGFSPKVATKESSAIWNPNAASNWSLVFSPAFGSYLHALNWRTLGEPEKEKAAMGWFYFSVAMLLLYACMALFMTSPEKADAASRGLGLIYLFVWYFSAGRTQAKYVREKFGSTYPRRPWGMPLLIGALAIVGIILAAAIVGAIVGVASA